MQEIFYIQLPFLSTKQWNQNTDRNNKTLEIMTVDKWIQLSLKWSKLWSCLEEVAHVL